MDIPQFIRDNTSDGRDIVEFLIDVMNGRIDGCKLNHQLTAARLLIIYGSQSDAAGHDDAPDFIADNAAPGSERRDKQWLTIDPALARLIRIKTDDGRDMCRLLIEVMQGRVENINPGHRVSAAKELLSRAFGKSPTGSLPKPQRSTESPRSTRSAKAAPPTPTEIASAPAATDAPTAVLDRPDQQIESDANRGIVIDVDNDPYLSVLDSPLYEFMDECEDPDFDPYLAALDEEYFKSYTGCKDPECEVHGEPPEINFDPNDYHY